MPYPAFPHINPRIGNSATIIFLLSAKQASPKEERESLPPARAPAQRKNRLVIELYPLPILHIGGRTMEPNQTRIPENNPDNEPQQSDLEQQPTEELDDLQKKIHSIPEAKWNLYQRGGGVLLGLICGGLLTYFSSFESIGMYGTIAAALIALFVPNLIERRIKRTVTKLRVSMMITLGLWLLASVLLMVVRGVPMISSPA